jgi:hypothetical protein
MLASRAVSVAIYAVLVWYVLAVTYKGGVEAGPIVRYTVILEIPVWEKFGLFL